jgi:hypothetical protein
LEETVCAKDSCCLNKKAANQHSAVLAAFNDQIIQNMRLKRTPNFTKDLMNIFYILKRQLSTTALT